MPLLDLYFNKRLADFENKLQEPALQAGAGPKAPKVTAGQVVTEAYNKLYLQFRKKRKGPSQRPRASPQGPTATEQAAATVGQ